MRSRDVSGLAKARRAASGNIEMGCHVPETLCLARRAEFVHGFSWTS